MSDDQWTISDRLCHLATSYQTDTDSKARSRGGGEGREDEDTRTQGDAEDF